MMKRRGEAGETLAEILVSTTLLGIVGIGVIGAIASVLISTDIDRKTSQAETVLRSYAAAITRAEYADGATPGSYAPDAVDFDVPERYEATVAAVACWDGLGPPVVATVPSAGGALTFGACGDPDAGLQRLEVAVTAVDGSGTPTGRSHERVTLFKRRSE